LSSTSGKSSSPISEEAIGNLWPVFTEAVLSRLDTGAREYGDESFGRDPVELAGEIEQELMDVTGWSFVLFCRMKRLEKKIAALEATVTAA
jgi:hypothetical protein